MTQLSLSIPESGPVRLTAEDMKRIDTQLEAVTYVMARREWVTLRVIQVRLSIWFRLSASEASISARLRDLRKPQFGGYTVERRRVEGQQGLWEYRVSGQIQR